MKDCNCPASLRGTKQVRLSVSILIFVVVLAVPWFAGCGGVSSVPKPLPTPGPSPAVNPNAVTTVFATDASGRLFVLNSGNGTSMSLPLPGGPAGIAITPDGSRAYVTLAAADKIAVIDTQRNTILAEVPVGSQPMAVAISPDGQFAWVANANAGTVSVISTASNQVVKTINTDSAPWTLAFSHDGSQVYVALIDFSGFPIGGPHPQNAIAVINAARQTITKLITGTTGISMTASPTRPEMYLILGENAMFVIDTDLNEVVAQIALDSDQQKGVAVSADGKTIYAIGHGMVDIGHVEPPNPTVPSTVYVISADQRAVIAKAHTDPGLTALAIDPAGKIAYLLQDETTQTGIRTINLDTLAFSSLQSVGAAPMNVTVSRH